MFKSRILYGLMAGAVLLGLLGGCGVPSLPPLSGGTTEPADGYVATVPSVLRAGQVEGIGVSLLRGERPVAGDVSLRLLQEGRAVAEGGGRVEGKGTVSLSVPRVSEGEYTLEVSGQGFRDQAAVRVEDGTIVFVETDKPIYKPGQTVHIRVLTLDAELRPVKADTSVEVQDAKGIKVYKKTASADELGMASLDLPLSTEPNLGVWKVTAESGKRKAQIDVRVEEYVLPKFEVNVDLPRQWVLADQPITGTIGAEYSYGKPVKGEVQIKAMRYVGTWQQFASLNRQLDGKTTFQLPAVGYVAGVPAAGGMGNVSLEVTVREQSTGYEGKTTQLLTVASAPLTLQVIPESGALKPTLPFSLLVLSQSPDKKPVDAKVDLALAYQDKDFKQLTLENRQVSTKNGKGLLQINVPKDAVSLSLQARSGNAVTSLSLQAGYSPSGNFVHVEQVGDPQLKVGGTARFKVSSTREANSFYYEVLARGKVVFSDQSRSPDLEVPLSPLMAPSARLLVYQILPNSEVAADSLPFTVLGDYPSQVQVSFPKGEAAPGEELQLGVQTDGPAKVGLAAVDRSVYILAENRLNLQQVFDELERLYMKPQVELHDARVSMPTLNAPGARDVFKDAGVVVLSNKQVPEGKKYEVQQKNGALLGRAGDVMEMAPGAPQIAAAPQAPSEGRASQAASAGTGLAEVQRVRQFFPETWLWTDLITDASGRAKLPVKAPDSITTWMVRAVGLSRDKGLGIGETQLKVFQPFFLSADLPYSAIRGEELPAKIALYNYLATPQEISVEVKQADWFSLLDESVKTVTVAPNEVGGLEFKIRPRELGTGKLEVTARSKEAADGVIKELLVEAEGVQREQVENLVLSAEAARTITTAAPPEAIAGSPRASVAVTGNYLTQTIEGLEKLLQMPFGCGEQNMLLFAPDVFISRYLRATNQSKPEIMAKAEQLMITGYQRQLTYRRNDGSFSAFGNNDKEGSLWLTAFVLKTFAQAKDLIYIDQSVLDAARNWIVGHQKGDGSFESVGFVAHQELLGGLKGKDALTAFTAIALREGGDTAASGKAISYLEGRLSQIDDSYTMAITAYALALAKSPQAGAAHDRLMGMAVQDDEGLHWKSGSEEPRPLQPMPRRGEAAPVAPMPPQHNQSADIEATAYGTLALVEQGDRLNASRAARWLVSKRNAYGGFGSTQDTVVGLQALTRYATDARSDVDLTITLRAGDFRKEVRVGAGNADVLQLVDVPVGPEVTIEARGKGQAVVQGVRRFNLPAAEKKDSSAFAIDVKYGADNVQVNDIVDVTVAVQFNPPEPMQAGMVVLDVSVPTGFAPVSESIAAVAKQQPKVKRYDVAGRKVIFYIEDMTPGEKLAFSFQTRALYPVRAKAVASQAYSYYRPEWKGESLGGEIVVGVGN
ncbi:MAG: alpha-2-macroglobulin [Chloroflexota bacterium]|nr:MAG: alpha-2-macroglobulin [Chloroflexota bacterium]